MFGFGWFVREGSRLRVGIGGCLRVLEVVEWWGVSVAFGEKLFIGLIAPHVDLRFGRWLYGYRTRNIGEIGCCSIIHTYILEQNMYKQNCLLQ